MADRKNIKRVRARHPRKGRGGLLVGAGIGITIGVAAAIAGRGAGETPARASAQAGSIENATLAADSSARREHVRPEAKAPGSSLAKSSATRTPRSKWKNDPKLLTRPQPKTASELGREGPARAARGSNGTYSQTALAFHFKTDIYEEPVSSARVIGTLRRGSHVGVEKNVTGSGCKGGTWYKLASGGYGCSSAGFMASAEPKEFWIRQPKPAVGKALPFRYGKAETGGLRLWRLPKASELKPLAAFAKGRGSKPEVVESVISGDVLLALDRVEEHLGGRYYRTVRGRYIAAESVQEKEAPEMVGERLGRGGSSLPLAFVFGSDGAPVLEPAGDGSWKAAGRAEVHARFAVEGLGDDKSGTATLVLTKEGRAVPRKFVRIARRVDPPADIGRRDKWIHVDTAEQTLVAYEGQRPVMATLVSTGRDYDGFVTPAGTFRVEHKHISKTMRGSDPKEGTYEVEEVPWTMFYHESFALHGAYWHDQFGNKKSHGCTNLPPADARWLFYWTAPDLPPEWHSSRKEPGTLIVITNG